MASFASILSTSDCRTWVVSDEVGLGRKMGEGERRGGPLSPQGRQKPLSNTPSTQGSEVILLHSSRLLCREPDGVGGKKVGGGGVLEGCGASGTLLRPLSLVGRGRVGVGLGRGRRERGVSLIFGGGTIS